MTKHKNNKEQAILNAAKEEFLEKGFDGARTTSIAKSAGVTHAMLHYYFNTKEELFSSIFEDLISEMAQNLTLLFADSNKSLMERIKEGLALHFDFVTANARLPLFIMREIASRPDRIHLIEDTVTKNASQLFMTLQKSINEAASRGEIAHIDAPTLLIDMLSLNVFPHLVQPLFNEVVAKDTKEAELFLEARKQENIEIITRRLIPNKQ